MILSPKNNKNKKEVKDSLTSILKKEIEKSPKYYTSIGSNSNNIKELREFLYNL